MILCDDLTGNFIPLNSISLIVTAFIQILLRITPLDFTFFHDGNQIQHRVSIRHTQQRANFFV